MGIHGFLFHLSQFNLGFLVPASKIAWYAFSNISSHEKIQGLHYCFLSVRVMPHTFYEICINYASASQLRHRLLDAFSFLFMLVFQDLFISPPS